MTFTLACIETAFLSTLPVRGATIPQRQRLQRYDISIHAPREGSDFSAGGKTGDAKNFYPRSPRGERRSRSSMRIRDSPFLSTLPARGATCPICAKITANRNISIHAPREGSDPGCPARPGRQSDFYPRSPRGERRVEEHKGEILAGFLSTLPARGATRITPCKARNAEFLSTLPARGATCKRWPTGRGY